MAIKIRGRGNQATDEVATPPKAKPKPKPRAGRKSTTRPAKPAAETPAKRGPGRPRKPEGQPPVRRDTGVDARLEAKLLKLVDKAGKRREAAEIEHKEAINALHEVAQEALEAGVSMAKVTDHSGISRQWLYKMGTFAGRTNGNGSSKPAAKAKPKAKPAASKSTANKSTGTTGSPRRRIRSVTQ